MKFCSLALILLVSLGFTKCQDPVKVTTYYESKCPDSIRFFTTQLEPTYNLLYSTGIMVAETFAYGKANSYPRASGDGYIFTCQHGQDECYGNKVAGCAQKYITDHEIFLSFDFCLMGSPDPPFAGEACANQVGVDYSPIGTCANSTEGENLLYAVGVQEDALNPSVTYIPWIIIDDVFTQNNLDDAQNDLLSLVCSTYTGILPPECTPA